LTCGYHENPIGVENLNPTFSWIVKSELENQNQSAYQILVATSPELLTPVKADMWNSEKVNSDRSIFLRYSGKELQPMQKYYWKVKIWNQNNTNWSQANHFQMGLINEKNWNEAKWISLNADSRKSEYSSRKVQSESMPQPEIRTPYPVGYFRKDFQSGKQIEKAQIYVAALGYYEAYLNGEKVGDHVLDPAPTSYDDYALYVVHDVTTQIKQDKNELGLIVGNGFYGQTVAFMSDLAYGRPAAKVLLQIQYKDGTTKNIVSDNSWKATTGPIVFDNVYAGETYDARSEIEGWNTMDCKTENWINATESNPVVGKLKPQLIPAIKVVGQLNSKKIFKAENGNWIVDFGQNISGWCKIKVKEKEGQIIHLLYAEVLTRKGDAVEPYSAGKFATAVDQEDIYICKGSDWEEWQPRFTYQGFQFVEIAGLSEKPAAENIQAMLVNTDVEKIGSFACSDELLNKMVEVSNRTILGNLHGIPEDCPHREKCGWLGDAQVVAEYSLFNFNMAAFYEKYLDDIRSQLAPTQSGKKDGTEYRIPTMVAPGKRKAGVAKLDWGIAAIYLPWYNYLHTGDFSLIEKHYLEMKEMVNYYLTFKNENGIIENGLGDWCPPLWDRQNNPGAMECHPFVSANAYFYDILKIMKVFAEKTHDNEFAKVMDEESQQLIKAFNHQYLEEIGGKYKWYGSQTGTVMAIQFGMVPDLFKEQVIEGLKYDIVTVKDEHHATGIHGNRYIYSLLNELGEEELSYRILTNPEFPSQAYILNSGLNTWPERQWEWDSGIEWDRSLNHPMQGGFSAFFYESVAGIKPLAEYPGYKKFEIKPLFFGQLDFAEAEVQSPYGKIASRWDINGSMVLLKVTIPFNTSADVIIPTTNRSAVKINKESVEGFSHRNSGKNITINLGSGSYILEFENRK
jgi:alpha-L-rhamnosidase